MRVADAAVVHMLELVDGIARQRAGSRRRGAARREGDVAFPRPDLELVEAGFGAGGAEDREAHELREHGGQRFLIARELDRRAPPRIRTCLPRRARRHHVRRQLRVERGEPRLDLRQLGGAFGGHRQVAFAVLHPREHRRQRVVLLVRDRIELVGMAPRATDRQPEERGAGRGHHVVEFHDALLRREHGIRAADDVDRATDQEARGHRGAQRVAGQLLANELVVRQVVGERAEHVVAEPPRVRPVAVGLETVGLGEADHVEPMPAPPLAVARIRQHPIDQVLERVCARIGDEGGDLFGQRRHAEHHEVQSPDQRRTIGFRREREPGLGQARDHEGVDGVLPLLADHGRHRRPPHRLEGPMRGDFGRRHFGLRPEARRQEPQHQPGQATEMHCVHGATCARTCRRFRTYRGVVGPTNSTRPAPPHPDSSC